MKKAILVAMFISAAGLASLILYQKLTLDDGRLHIVFCNVGQGDGIFVRTPKSFDMLIDGGPDTKVLDCLSRHMPFWDRTIELMVLSHPHADHFAGLIDVMKRYSIVYFVTEKLTSENLVFQEFMQQVLANKLKQKYLFTGARIKTNDQVVLEILSPSESFLASTSPNGTIGESKEFASLISLLSFQSFQLLLTGDSQARGLQEAIESRSLDSVDVLQVPHHGSKTGLSQDILDRLRPGLAVISVGKNNRYGHPGRETLAILQDKNIKTLRTDQNGEIEIVSDGKTWSVKTRAL